MIQIKVDTRKFDRQIGKIEKDLYSITNTRNINNVTRAVAVIAAKRYMLDLNIKAKAMPKTFHHIYEWNHVGENDFKLIKIRRSIVSDRSASLDIIFKQSRRKVPISEILSTPGKSGKFVRKTGVFKNKAEFMESGQSAKYITQRTIAIPTSDGKIKFRPKGTEIIIKNPGGKQTTMAVSKFTSKWEKTNMDSAIRKTGIFQELSTDIAKVMSMPQYNQREISSIIKAVCDRYGQSERNF